MRPTTSGGRLVCTVRVVAAATALVVAAALAGCAGVGLSPEDARSHAAARTAVADLARDLHRGGTDTIDDYARWADADIEGSNVQLIGYEAYPGAVHGEPFGALRFLATVQLLPQYGEGEPYTACFESEFDFWGVATEPGDWSDDAAVARDIECPADAHPIAPPVDTRAIHVVPEGTEAVVVEVLQNAPAATSADDIVMEVTERMPQPTGEREVAFEPKAAVVDGEIGFAMGDADDCLLVKRSVDGVEVLYIPEILLQPGELGCAPDTALRPGDQLRSPH
ncbi:hypothetical protein [Agromyces albus]|uniref:hypothetical protein n=1 Tax=Agromyces albus TaxID=205332 RepID=UPI00277DE00C|nr:hypothetical protein [Agromyces albus]MDQ0574320.1 hypothetical protein [Agromyces albus]